MEFMKKESGQRGEMLLAIFKYTYSLTTLQDEGWYHIPVNYAPKTWPPKWLCFYQGKIFGKEAYRVERYGELESYEIVPYHELFPNKIESEKSNWLYLLSRAAQRTQAMAQNHSQFPPAPLNFHPNHMGKV
jgi:hypothetical protein